MALRYQPASKEAEAFYEEALLKLAKVAKKHGNQMTLMELLAVMGTATGRMLCAAYPNERELARATVLANIDHELATKAEGQPTEMSKQ